MATVLLVEDTAANMALATFLLQSAGHMVLPGRHVFITNPVKQFSALR
jgi:CheY-like chemotaxis protein